MTLKSRKIGFLAKNGLNIKEARAFAEQYSMADLRTLPYFRSLLVNRRLYVAKLKKKGYTDRQIQGTIANLYFRRGWDDNGKVDEWAMLRSFRRKSIESGDYIPPKHKGSHHGEGVKAEEIKKQAVRGKGFAQLQLDNIKERIKQPQTSSERKHLLELKEIWERKANG
jgi:hypothetical protein